METNKTITDILSELDLSELDMLLLEHIKKGLDSTWEIGYKPKRINP